MKDETKKVCLHCSTEIIQMAAGAREAVDLGNYDTAVKLLGEIVNHANEIIQNIEKKPPKKLDKCETNKL